MKYLLVIGSFIVVFSCKEEITFEQRIQAVMDEHFLKNVHDASGYEFVSIEEIDTQTMQEFREEEIELLMYQMTPPHDIRESYDKLEKTLKELLRYIPNDYDSKRKLEEIAERRQELAESKSDADSMRLLLSGSDKDSINAIRFFYKFRAPNQEGVKTLHKYWCRLNEDLTIKSTSKQEIEKE